MSGSIFSAAWYRVAHLQPSVRAQAQITRHVYRGERWYVLQDQASGRFLRLNPPAYAVLALLDGQHTVAQVWQQVGEQFGDDAPTQDEVLNLLSQLYQANVLLSEIQPDLDELAERSSKLKRQKLKQYLGNPLSLKFPLFNPEPLLTGLMALLPKWRWGIWLSLWALVVGMGLIQAAIHWDALTKDISTQVFTSDNMLLLALVFPLLKAIHELGHGLALKAFGCRCPEMGLMFLVMMPVPYVDAGAANGLPDKRQRMLVGLAGMMVELLVASLALYLWLAASPGVLKAALHQVVVLAGLTTLIFNANPLLRFDGYYVLADWLEIPNLGQKANRYLGVLVNRHLFGVEQGLLEMPLSPREGAWLLGYAISSFIYRTLISIGIVLMIASKFFFIGVLLALWAAWGGLLQPLLKQIGYLSHSPLLHGKRARAILLSGGFGMVLLLMLCLVPAPSWTNAQGVMWMGEQSRVRASVDCFGQTLLAQPGQAVVAGQALLSCSDPELDARFNQAQARLGELNSRLQHAQATDRVQAQMAQLDLQHQTNELQVLARKRGELIMRSPHAGIFGMAAPGDWPGRYLARGETIAYVLDPARFTLLSVVAQGEAAMVRQHTEQVQLRAVGRIEQLLYARIQREVPAASKQLPSLALSLQGGGQIGLDPGAQESGPQALNSLFQFELQFIGQAPPTRLGNRVFVRFIHPPEPVATQWYRSLRQQFMKRFSL